MHAQCLIEAGRQAVFQEAEERLDGRQPGVARSCCVAARLLEMFQEREDHRHVQMLDFQLAGLRPEAAVAAKVTSSWKL